jgi:hypothetical protein
MATSGVQPPDPEQHAQDALLPDPSRTSMGWAAAFLAAAVVLALLADLTNLDHDPAFDPKALPEPGLAVFAGFLAAAVIVERVLELLAPFVPWWTPPTPRVEQKKADRGYAMIGIATLLGVLASAACGLYFGHAIGMSLSRWADILLTGLAIGGGAKGLHEVLKSLQKAKGSGTTPG